MELDQASVQANGVSFAYLSAGPADGPLALCLHGFPDTAHSWRHLLPGLAAAGYRAAAPWMRGYAPTSVPEDGRYDVGTLAEDANALHEALGADERAVLIGHDWGATAVYGAAAAAPDRWRRVVAAAVPPAGGMGRAFLNFDQLKRSWYMFYFQSPLADVVVPLNDLEFIARLWADWSPGYDATDDVAHVRAALGETPNLSAALGYYRATFGSGGGGRAGGTSGSGGGGGSRGGGRLSQPTLYLHGATDGCIGAEFAEGAEAALPSESKVEIVPDTGHFLHLERPDEVNRLILDFVAS
jgi:pimeloyl-ACP methyl ester carboxylesterase